MGPTDRWQREDSSFVHNMATAGGQRDPQERLLLCVLLDAIMAPHIMSTDRNSPPQEVHRWKENSRAVKDVEWI